MDGGKCRQLYLNNLKKSTDNVLVRIWGKWNPCALWCDCKLAWAQISMPMKIPQKTNSYCLQFKLLLFSLILCTWVQKNRLATHPSMAPAQCCEDVSKHAHEPLSQLDCESQTWNPGLARTVWTSSQKQPARGSFPDWAIIHQSGSCQEGPWAHF